MDYVFDGCTEVLLREIMEASPEVRPKAEKLMGQLPDFQKVCLNTGLCPKGELLRSMVCRNFLRDALQRMEKKLSTVNQDETIDGVIRQTRDFIETVGEETEAERAYIVVRNLVIVADNIVKQAKRQALPAIVKQPVRMLHYRVELAGLQEFEGITGFSWERDIENLLNPKLPPMLPRQACENRYRHLFFNLLVRLIAIREMEKERAYP